MTRSALNDLSGYEPPPRVAYPPVIEFIRGQAFNAFIFVVFAGTAIWIGVAWVQLAEDSSAKKNSSGVPVDLIPLIKLLSVPLVCLLFTWFHVWLALQMKLAMQQPCLCRRAARTTFSMYQIVVFSRCRLIEQISIA